MSQTNLLHACMNVDKDFIKTEVYASKLLTDSSAIAFFTVNRRGVLNKGLLALKRKLGYIGLHVSFKGVERQLPDVSIVAKRFSCFQKLT